MQRALLIVLTISFVFGGSALNAAEKEKNTAKKSAGNPKSAGPLQQFKQATVPKYPNAGLNEYVLISDDLERDRANAEAVIQAKVELVRAMQTKTREHFEPSLALNFIFRSTDQFLDRNEYINNRIGDPLKVRQADYRNVIVQFIGDIALVTYSNIVEAQPGGPGAPKADMTWADILSKEGGRWKFTAMHLIEFRDLTTPKQ